MNRLFGAEAERVLSVLDSASDALRALSLIPETHDAALVRALQAHDCTRTVTCVQTLWRLEESKVLCCVLCACGTSASPVLCCHCIPFPLLSTLMRRMCVRAHRVCWITCMRKEASTMAPR